MLGGYDRRSSGKWAGTSPSPIILGEEMGPPQNGKAEEEDRRVLVGRAGLASICLMGEMRCHGQESNSQARSKTRHGGTSQREEGEPIDRKRAHYDSQILVRGGKDTKGGKTSCRPGETRGVGDSLFLKDA